MLPGKSSRPERGQRRIRRRSSPARRALGSLTGFLERLLEEPHESSAGVLGRIDPRAKITASILLVVALSLMHSLEAIAGCFVLVVLISGCLGAPIRRLCRLLIAPVIFTAAIAAPSTLNLITHGNALVVLHHFGSARFGPWTLPSELTVTDAGVYVAARLVLRVVACVSVVGLTALTTGRPRLLASLRAIGVPQAFVVILLMMQRYLEVLMRVAQDIHLAKISRSIRQRGIQEEHDWVAAGIGSLLRRSRALGEAVHLAMVSRGFDGSIRTLDSPRLRTRDLAFMLAIAAFTASMLVLDRAI